MWCRLLTSYLDLLSRTALVMEPPILENRNRSLTMRLQWLLQRLRRMPPLVTTHALAPPTRPEASKPPRFSFKSLGFIYGQQSTLSSSEEHAKKEKEKEASMSFIPLSRSDRRAREMAIQNTIVGPSPSLVHSTPESRNLQPSLISSRFVRS